MIRQSFAYKTLCGVVLVGVCQLGLALAQLVPVGQVYGPVPVAAVLDGDTLVLSSNVGPRTVRLIGVDAPERGQTGASGAAFGAQATAYLSSILPPGTPVWLELDRGTDDAFGRLLAYVYVKSTWGEWLVDDVRVHQVNLLIAEAGLASVMTIAPNFTYAELYRAAVSDARRNGLGMWADPESHVDLAAPSVPVSLHCALYNPDTPNDENGEWVSVIVAEPFDTTGLYLYDEGSASVFTLPSGVQQPGEIRVPNPGQGVWNNSGDIIYLKLGAETLDSWDYSGQLAAQGQTVCRADVPHPH